MMNPPCIFCDIIAENAPASVIYEDDLVIVFVDLYPVNPGHLLIVPKEHHSGMTAVKSSTLAHMMVIAQKMNQALRHSSIQCDGVNLFLADGEAAGQEVFHCHLHVYPRFHGDGFGFKYDRARHFKQMPRPLMDEMASLLKASL